MRDFLHNRPKANEPASGGEPVVKSAGLGAIAESGLKTVAGGHHHNGSEAQEAKVDLTYDAEGRVQEIRVTCRCGERIALRCTY